MRLPIARYLACIDGEGEFCPAFLPGDFVFSALGLKGVFPGSPEGTGGPILEQGIGQGGEIRF